MILNVTQFIAQGTFSCNAVCMPLHRKQITTLRNYANVMQVNIPHSHNCHVLTTLLYPTVPYSNYYMKLPHHLVMWGGDPPAVVMESTCTAF